MDVLGLGEHRLQSLGIFYSGVKKLSHFEGQFFGPFWPTTVSWGSNFWVGKRRNFLKSLLQASSLQPAYPGVGAEPQLKSGHFL